MSWTKIKALREERATHRAAMQSILDKADAEKRDLSADESAKFDELRGKAEAAARAEQRYEEVRALEMAGAKADDDAAEARSRDLDPSTGMPVRDLRNYSLLRAIRLRADGKPLDGLEGEASQEIARRTGRTPGGFFLPTTLEMRDVTIAGSAQAVATIKAANQFVESLRNATVVGSFGPTILSGLTGNVSIPVQSADAAAYWVAESTAPTESNPAINSQISLAPKTIGTFIDLSRKFLLQSSIDPELFARNEIFSRLAIETDRATLNGSGSGAEPEGILQNSSMSTDAIGANGGAITWDQVVKLETGVATANAATGNLGYVTNSKVMGAFKTVKKDSGSGIFLYENGQVNGYRVGVSNSVPSNLTKGDSNGVCSALIFGNWRDVIWATWSGIDILVDPYTGGNAGTVRINALQDLDIKFRRTASFRKTVDITT
jgi:HK97 family phage major capsid protein